MAANLGLAFKMGLAKKLDRDSEEKNAKLKRIQALNDRKREWLFQSYMTGSADRKKSVKARASMIKQAVTDGFSKESATLLEASGELGDHLSRIANLKQKGEFIKGGEVIALSGNSGGNKYNGLYYELRHNGKPFNPLKWTK